MSYSKQSLIHDLESQHDFSKSKFMIMVIDDDPEVLKLIKNYFSHYSCIQLYVYQNAKDAITQDIISLIDLLIIDIGLIAIDGFTVAKLIKSSRAIDLSTIYISSNKKYGHDVKKMCDSNCLFMPKPIQKDSTIMTVERFMNTSLWFKNLDGNRKVVPSQWRARSA